MQQQQGSLLHHYHLSLVWHDTKTTFKLQQLEKITECFPMFVHTLIKQAKEPQEEKVEDQEEGQVLSFVAEDT